jgi:hypothetical protein
MPKLNSTFFTGVVVGVIGVWAIHHFATPLPGGKGQ